MHLDLTTVSLNDQILILQVFPFSMRFLWQEDKIGSYLGDYLHTSPLSIALENMSVKNVFICRLFDY